LSGEMVTHFDTSYQMTEYQFEIKRYFLI